MVRREKQCYKWKRKTMLRLCAIWKSFYASSQVNMRNITITRPSSSIFITRSHAERMVSLSFISSFIELFSFMGLMVKSIFTFQSYKNIHNQLSPEQRPSVEICIKLTIRQAQFTDNPFAKMKRKHEPPKPGQPEIKGRASPRAPIIAYDLGSTTALKIICQFTRQH